MRDKRIKELVLTAIILSIVVLLQLFASVVKFGQFQISLVLIPITIGAILLGAKTGAFLGFVFGLIVILTGDAAFFMSYGGLATVIIVLSKGTLAGFLAGFIYNILKEKKNISCITAAIITPIVNTTVFIIGTILFLSDALVAASGGSNSIVYLFTVMIGLNFIVELTITVILAPAIIRIVDIFKNQFDK